MVAHVALVMVLVSRVTAPLRASALPSSVAPVVIEIEVRARMFPTNCAARADRRRAADLPEHVAGLRPADQRDAAAGAGGQRRSGLKDEHGIGVALGVEGESRR